MISIKCIAIDDEPPALRQMVEYISMVPYLDLQGTFENPIDAMYFLKEHRVDLIFLDIQMENLTGMEFLKLLNNKPAVVLTTAYDSYALQAFDLEVDDYLLKPISFDRFVKASEKIYDKLNSRTAPVNSVIEQSTLEKDYFFVRTEFRIQRIDFDDILYIEGRKEYLKIVLMTERILTKQNFKEMISTLPELGFIRVHKSFIVAINKIGSIRNNRITIGEKSIPIGSTYKELFYKAIGER